MNTFATAYAKPASALLLALFFLIQCSKDGKSPTGGGDKKPPTGTEVTTLYGRITDDSGASLSGVIVTAGTKADTTDAYGLFSLDEATVPKGRAVVLARKEGYHTGAKAASPGSGGATPIGMRLMKKIIYSVNATAGGKVNVAGGATLELPAGSLVTSTGSAYSGTARVAANFLAPANADFADFFSGDNAGLTSGDQEVGLVSLGVLRVELTASNGNPLKLADGKSATLRYPKPAGIDAPESMPLWYFDEEPGIWKEEGSATLKDGAYEGAVTHFTDWNCDFKGPNGTIQITIIPPPTSSCDSIPLDGIVVRLGDDKGITDREGKVTFVRAQAGRPLRFDIRAEDNNGNYFMSEPVPITVPADDTADQTVTLDSPCPTTLEGGLVGCNGEPIEGTVSATTTEGLEFDFTVGGKFFLHVPDDLPLTLNATDKKGNKLAPIVVPKLGPGERRSAGKLKVCGEATAAPVFHLKHSGMDGYSNHSLSPNGGFLALGLDLGGVAIYDLSSRKAVMEFPSADVLTPEDWSDDNKRLLINDFTSTTILEISGSAPKTLATLDSVAYASLSADGRTVLGFRPAARGKLAYLPGTLSLYSADDGSVIKELHPTDFSPQVFLAPFGTEYSLPFDLVRGLDAFTYLTTQKSAVFRVWSISGDSLIRELDIGKPWSPFESAGLNGIEFSAGSERLGVSDSAGFWDIYDMVNGGKITTLNFRAVSPVQTSNEEIRIGKDNLYATTILDAVQVLLRMSYKDASVTLVEVPKQKTATTYVNFIHVSQDEKTVSANVRDSLMVWIPK
jgi:hypothetical protein